jgi:hypothetical protein
VKGRDWISLSSVSFNLKLCNLMKRKEFAYFKRKEEKEGRKERNMTPKSEVGL